MRKICKSRDYFELLLSCLPVVRTKVRLDFFFRREPQVIKNLKTALINPLSKWNSRVHQMCWKKIEFFVEEKTRGGEWKINVENHKISLQFKNFIDMLLHENIVKVSIQKPSNSIFYVFPSMLSFFFPFLSVFEASIDFSSFFEFFFLSCMHIKWKKLHFRFQHRISYRMNSISSEKKCRMKKGGKRRGNWILKQYHQHHHREFPLFPFLFLFVVRFSFQLKFDL